MRPKQKAIEENAAPARPREYVFGMQASESMSRKNVEKNDSKISSTIMLRAELITNCIRKNDGQVVEDIAKSTGVEAI